jgi:bacteriocin-like protein
MYNGTIQLIKVKKTTMHKNNLTFLANDATKRSNEKNVPAELVELSEKDLQQIIGGFAPSNKGKIFFGNIYFGTL